MFGIHSQTPEITVGDKNTCMHTLKKIYREHAFFVLI